MSELGGDERARLELLLGIMREHGLDALTLRVDGLTYELVRREAAAPAAPALAAAPAAPEAPSAAEPAVRRPGAGVQRIASPLVGVFYRAAAPDQPPFVELGDRVEAGQVICIIEAMKMMNEITSDFAGIVTHIGPENGALVTVDEDLLWIQP